MKKNYADDIQKEALNIKSTMTDEEFLSSQEYFSFLQSYIKGVLQGIKRGKLIEVNCFSDKRNSMTACTNGYTVCTNTMDANIMSMGTRAERHYANLGKVCHEIWHILFTDFAIANSKAVETNSVRPFKWYKPLPNSTPNADKIVDRINSGDKLFEAIYLKFSGIVSNILEDGYINRRGSFLMPGVPATGVRLYNRYMMRAYGTSAKIMGVDLFSSFIQLFQATYFGTPPKYDITDPEQKEKYDFCKGLLDKAETRMKEYMREHSGKRRSVLEDEIVCIFYPLLDRYIEEKKDELQQQLQNQQQSQQNQQRKGKSKPSQPQSGNSQVNSQTSQGSQGSQDSQCSQDSQSSQCSQSSGTGGLSGKDIRDILDALEDSISRNVNTTNDPSGSSKPISDSEVGDAGNDDGNDSSSDNQQSTQNSQDGAANTDSALTEAMQKAFEEVENQVCKTKAQNAVEKQHKDDLGQEMRSLLDSVGDTMRNNNSLKGYSKRFSRPDVDQRKVDQFDSIVANNNDVIETTVRMLKKILMDKCHNLYSAGYRMGRLDCKAVARSEFYQDGKIFRRKNEKELKKVAFAILIDQSGSMCGSKERSAREAAIVTEEILRRLNVPLMVVGHCVESGSFHISSFVDYDNVDNNDRYRLMETYSNGCNEDGLAIGYCCEKLLERPEDEKVLIVISDGAPSAEITDVDSMSLAIETVQKYRTKKVRIFGAVIDGNFAAIRKIYGDQTLDCTKGNLGTELVGLIHRYVAR